MNIAVITGASSGIGKEFCKNLDSEGFDEIWGLGLGKENFEALKKELKTNLRYFDMDMTKLENLEIYKSALEETSPNVKWLINCSGFGKFGRHDEIDVLTSLNMIDLNCKALVYMTEVTLPFMHEGGRIIEVASVAAFQPVPYIGVYGATKAFVRSYSGAMREELKYRKISLTCVCPFWTKTAFFDRATKINAKTENTVITKYVVMYDSAKVVKKAVKDAKKGKATSIYGFIARTQVRMSKLLPASWINKVWVKQQKFDKKYSGK